MPVMNRQQLERLYRELTERCHRLTVVVTPRRLADDREGCRGRSRWPNPDEMRATTGDGSELRVAVADLQAVLKELTRL